MSGFELALAVAAGVAVTAFLITAFVAGQRRRSKEPPPVPVPGAAGTGPGDRPWRTPRPDDGSAPRTPGNTGDGTGSRRAS
ncbi:hypothetical protein [Kitasatospora sp. NBC_01539]|uniref:hypothetical protein n=1 Tax=Kitasatospora sp. NBC_01539 TaxID=2903577 RepID=UPI0038600CB6